MIYAPVAPIHELYELVVIAEATAKVTLTEHRINAILEYIYYEGIGISIDTPDPEFRALTEMGLILPKPVLDGAIFFDITPLGIARLNPRDYMARFDVLDEDNKETDADQERRDKGWVF